MSTHGWITVVACTGERAGDLGYSTRAPQPALPPAGVSKPGLVLLEPRRARLQPVGTKTVRATCARSRRRWASRPLSRAAPMRELDGRRRRCARPDARRGLFRSP